MTTFQKLIIRLKKDLDVDVYDVRRTYVGNQQKRSGAWLWTANRGNIGSIWSASDIVKAKKISCMSPSYNPIEIEIFVEDLNQS